VPQICAAACALLWAMAMLVVTAQAACPFAESFCSPGTHLVHGMQPPWLATPIR